MVTTRLRSIAAVSWSITKDDATHTTVQYAVLKEYVHLEGKWEGATILPCQIEPN